MSNTRLGLVRCEHCGRQFNAHSAARHIPWCAKQRAEAQKHKISAEKRQALERYKWRISYRPTNQIAGNGAPRQVREQQQLSSVGHKLKQSSVNSSATLSSPSAGSTTSIGTSITSSIGPLHRRPRNQQQQPSGALPGSRKPTVGQLKRSISSVTLTKQQQQQPTTMKGSWKESSGRDSVQSTATFTRDQPRTKSVSDLSSMNLIVESLAKRVEEIYAQNQVLLLSLSRGNLSGLGAQVQSEEEEEQERESGDISGGSSSRCHHCKTSCFQQANYCHKCGCKVRVAISPSPD